MSIQKIDNEKITAYCHSSLADIPNKTASEMKEFFDAMPKKVLIPKINELIDEINSDSYGKSAYEVAVDAGFEGSLDEWLLSLKGETGDVGPKGDTGEKGERGEQGIQGKQGKCGIEDVEQLDNYTDKGVYRLNGELYIAEPMLWNTDLSVGFRFTGEYKTSVIEFSQGSIPNGDTLKGFPLLKYKNTLGDGTGSTYLFLEYDDSGKELLSIYISQSATETPSLYITTTFFDGDFMDCSELVTEQKTEGLGEDICGNWQLISEYFYAYGGQNIKRLATEKFVGESVLKAVKSGAGVSISDVSAIPHTMEIKVSGVDNPCDVEVYRYGKNLYDGDVVSTINAINKDGVFEQIVADTRDFFSFVIQKYLDDAHVGYITTKNIYEPTVASATFKKTAEFNRLRVGHNGASKNCMCIIDISNLVNGEVYTIQLNITNTTQGSYSWQDIQIEAGNIATEYQDFRALDSFYPNAEGKFDYDVTDGEDATFITNTEGAVIEVRYYRDINKTFAQLKQAVIALGGLV